MFDTKEIIKQIQQSVETNRDDVRFIKRMEVGQIVRQGDIYIHKVNESHKGGMLQSVNQLAVGNSKGSRHIAESPAKCYVGTNKPETCNDAIFLGPLVKSESRFTISHPEHANIVLPSGCYQITHQLDPRTQERVRD